MTSNAAPYQIAPSNESVVALEIFKSGLKTGKMHVLFFEQYQGEALYNRDKPEESSIRLVIEARSAVCRDEWLKPAERKKVLAEVLEPILVADQHPQLTFSSSRVARKASSRFEISGTLTMREISKPVTADVAITSIGDDRLELDGNAQVSFSDYNLTPPSSAMGLIRTKDRMLFRFLLWGEKSQAAAQR
jgi:polyisoprenoid-binding protein YceI